MAARRRRLRALADAIGILPSYVDQGGIRRETSDEARVALLRAMGLDASTEDAAAAALAGIQAERHARLLDPVHVTQRAPAALAVTIRAAKRHRPGSRERVPWELEVTTETGDHHRAAGRAAVAADGSVRLRMPVALPHGHHRVHVRVDDGAQRAGEQTIIVTPERCPTPADLLPRRGVFGLLANLYTVRSAHNWGAGDFADLAALVDWCADIGAAFVGVNPLHALGNRGDEISPYRPISRLYRNPLYLDIEAVPELAESADARRLVTAITERDVPALRTSDHVDYERVMAHKAAVAQALHRTFRERHRDGGSSRRRAYRAYREREGHALDDFATFMALRDVLAHDDPGRLDWHAWPAELHDPRGRAVEELRSRHEERVDFHRYLQFELDRQLGAIAATASERGVPIGVYQDLAIGSSPSGSDTWAFRDLFLDTASIGAPPDDYSTTGQNWGLPPIDPRALRRSAYEYWTLLVRNALQHAGALRIDHVMGLFRQFWIPAGASGAEGAYIAFPADDLLGIVALEATRAGALVVGEDLGTVPHGLPARLARWGILSTRVLYFARTKRGAFLPGARYPERALVSANTHDMAPLAGFREGRDLELRRAAKILTDDTALEDARAARTRECTALDRRLQAETFLPPGREPTDATELTTAVHAFLAATPAALVGISLDDLAGERDPVNLPGVGLDGYPSWSRRMSRPLEELRTAPDVERAVTVAARHRRPAATTSRRRLAGSRPAR